MKRLFWIHDESLCQPAQATDDDLLVFCWHQDYFSQQAWSAKRLVFIYETLCTLPISIYAGDPNEIFSALKETHQISELLVQRPFDPQLKDHIERVSQTHTLNYYDPPRLIDDSRLKPSKRFHAYWQQIQAKLLNRVEQKLPFTRYHQQAKHQKNQS
ncbi:MAG: hypothetical protein IE928_07090 [Gammaproteobacteria bacterium]|nr:hypothetical protein [Gammaproteobacteria bacterium]